MYKRILVILSFIMVLALLSVNCHASLNWNTEVFNSDGADDTHLQSESQTIQITSSIFFVCYYDIVNTRYMAEVYSFSNITGEYTLEKEQIIYDDDYNDETGHAFDVTVYYEAGTYFRFIYAYIDQHSSGNDIIYERVWSYSITGKSFSPGQDQLTIYSGELEYPYIHVDSYLYHIYFTYKTSDNDIKVSKYSVQTNNPDYYDIVYDTYSIILSSSYVLTLTDTVMFGDRLLITYYKANDGNVYGCTYVAYSVGTEALLYEHNESLESFGQEQRISYVGSGNGILITEGRVIGIYLNETYVPIGILQSGYYFDEYTRPHLCVLSSTHIYLSVHPLVFSLIRNDHNYTPDFAFYGYAYEYGDFDLFTVSGSENLMILWTQYGLFIYRYLLNEETEILSVEVTIHPPSTIPDEPGEEEIRDFAIASVTTIVVFILLPIILGLWTGGIGITAGFGIMSIINGIQGNETLLIVGLIVTFIFANELRKEG